MLYFFHVDKGVMMTLEMNLALTSVQKLKEVIYEKTDIPPESQILMISGGIALQGFENVCNYSAGTDTNPIFLFDLAKIRSFKQYPVPVSVEPENEDTEIKALEAKIKEKVEMALKQPPSHGSANECDNLVQYIYKCAKELFQKCEDTIMYQHLQQQGWAAVVANLEDILFILRKNFEVFENIYSEFLKTRAYRLEILERFEEDLELLKKVPLLPALSRSYWRIGKIPLYTGPIIDYENFVIMEKNEEGVENLSSMNQQASLLDYVDEDDLEQILNDSRKRLLMFDIHLKNKLDSDFNYIMREFKEKSDIKEIKGLGERLSQLDNLLRDGTKIMSELKITVEQMYRTKSRKTSMKDGTSYPSFCESNEHLLKIMQNNFAKISDIRRRCNKAKKELSFSIISRLNWILFLEHRVRDLDYYMSIGVDNIKLLETSLSMFEQMHHAPRLYFSAICEVIRRQKFSKRFLQWANLLSSESKEIWEKEVEKRKNFTSQLACHFLENLFPGLDANPPDYATEKPMEFDHHLPQLNIKTIDILRTCVPELQDLLVIEEPVAIPPVIEAGLRSTENTNTLTPSSYGKEVMSELFTSAVPSPQKLNERETPDRSEERLPSPKRAATSRPSSFVREQPESETDTEEFEKVCGSISDGMFSPVETVPDNKSTKTKHPFPSSPSDSKHIKLDPSHRVTGLTGPSFKLDPDNSKKSSSPSECVLSPAIEMSPEEFVSQDFYIDESMPSSYTESTATTTTTSSGTNKHHSHPHHTTHRKSHHVLTAELQKELEQKNFALQALKDELGNCRMQVETLQARLNPLTQLNYEAVFTDLRNQMERLKDQVRGDGMSYKTYINEVSSRILEVLETIQKETELNKEMAVKTALGVAQLEEDEKRNTLQAQLVDINRELEIYQEQTRDHITQIEVLKCKMKEERLQLIAEKEECVKKLTLEHELEMESLKEQWNKDEKRILDEVTFLRENIESELRSKEELRTHFELKCKENEEMCNQLAVEKSNLEKQKIEIEQAFNNERLRIQEDHQENLRSNMEKLRCTLEKEVEQKMEKERKEMEEKHNEELMRCRDLWEVQKEEEVEGKKEELKNQLKFEYEQKLEEAKQRYKMELDGLRSRFRMMTTASMDKSPSETSLEKFERGDFVETNYHDLMLTKLREELLEEKEKALDELRRSLEEKYKVTLQEERLRNEEMRKEEVKRIETEKQEMFNAAFKEVTQDKERVIEDLRLRVEFLTDETEKLRKSHTKAQEAAMALQMNMPLETKEWQERCEAYKKEVDRLEKEVERAKRLSFVSDRHPDVCMDDVSSSSSTSTITSEVQNFEVQKLQFENKELRAALGRATCERKRVSLDDAQIHDSVLVVWDDTYQQYRILLENQPILHFLHSDSYQSLGLSKGPERPEKLFCTAQVTKKKEFCQAKRDGNRFRVPKGTKFYRVEAGPYGASTNPRQERESEDSLRRDNTTATTSSSSSSVPRMSTFSTLTTDVPVSTAGSMVATSSAASQAVLGQESSPDFSERKSTSSTP